MNPISKGILRSLLYADIFDYPLESAQLWRYCILETTVSKKEFDKALNKLPKIVGFFKGFYFLAGKKNIVEIRKKREKISEKKIRLAQKIARYCSIAPTVLFIGLSGNVAMRNAKDLDDIDFFVIAKKNTLWTTRLLLLTILQILGKRRKKRSKHVKNTICLNMLIDETKLAFSKKDQNLYIAHEIVQIIPVFDRADIYRKFLLANNWVGNYLPNALKRRTGQNYTPVPLKGTGQAQKNAESLFSVAAGIVSLISVLEFPARRLQLLLMKKRTREIVTNSYAAFHPIDYKTIILNAYKKKLQQYGL